MRTPRFQLTQDSDHVIITIHAPYCDLKNLEVDIDNNVFMFYCSPFFLRLNLPKPIKQTDTSRGKFDAETHDFVIFIDKVNKDEHFPDLDMITKLLQPPTKKNVNLAQIEVLSEEISEDSEWYSEQDTEEKTGLVNSSGYGFGNQITDYLESTQETLSGILDDLETISMECNQRKELRNYYENKQFDPDIYLYQFFNTDEINNLLECDPPWSNLTKQEVKFTTTELDILKELPNKEYLLTEEQEYQVLLSLIDILFGYCYDKRIFMFENSCESGWAINKLSSTLSWFDKFESLKEVLIAGYRRSLILPLYRNWNLTEKVFADLKNLLKLGRKFILRCVLDIYQLFKMGSCTDPRYILNDLYIKDYCIFIQKMDSKQLEDIVGEIELITIDKEHLLLNLPVIEAKAISELLTSDDSSSESGDTSSDIDSDDSTITQSSGDETNNKIDVLSKKIDKKLNIM